MSQSSAGSDTKEKVIALKKANNKELLTLIKTLGDILPAGQGAQIYERFFGFKVNEGYCAIGGLISALLTSYDLY